MAVPVVRDEGSLALQDGAAELELPSPSKEALPNIVGLTDIRGKTKDGEYRYRIGNIVPRQCDTGFGLQVSGQGGIPKLRVTVSNSKARLVKGERIVNPESAKLFDMSVDYHVHQTSDSIWNPLDGIKEKGTLDLVLEVHVDAEISWDKQSKRWTIDKDAISLKPDGEFKFASHSSNHQWLTWMINPALNLVFNDYVERSLVVAIKAFLPEKLPITLPKYIQDSIVEHFDRSPQSEMTFNGQLSWFLPVLQGGTELLQWPWSPAKDEKELKKAAVAEAAPTTHLKKNVLAIPISFKDHNDQNDYDFEIGNLVPHRMNVEVDAQLHHSADGPEVTARLSATCKSSKAEKCIEPAKVDIDVDYWVKCESIKCGYFKDSGTVVLTVDTRMAVTLVLKDINGKNQWALKALPPKGAMMMDAEMKLKDSSLAVVVNPILKFLFNDWLEQKLIDYVAAKMLPKVPEYIPQQYTDLVAGPLRHMSKSKFHMRSNVDCTIPRDSATVYLEDRLALDNARLHK